MAVIPSARSTTRGRCGRSRWPWRPTTRVSTSGREFQLSLIDSIKQWETDGGAEPWSYYEHWLQALETVLAGNGKLSEAVLDDQTRSVLATPRNANHHEAHREPVAVDPAR